MMTIDEAIKYCEGMAEEQDMKAGFETDNQTYIMSEMERERYRECANEYRQLAEWLRELKALKDFAKFVAESVMDEEFEENSGFYAEVYCRKLHKIGFIEAEGDKWIFNTDEVNVDEKL